MLNTTFAHFRIIKMLGQGGMGEVYLAEDLELHRKVAIKFLPSQYLTEPELKARFKREAQAAAALNHPNIVTIYEFGEYQLRPFLAMEYVDGESLKELLFREALPINKAFDMAMQICEGLNAAHRAGIVHRDIKPANLLIDKSGRVKIADFGLAKLQGDSFLTKDGMAMGTTHYMSPEQVLAQPLNSRSDIFSMGVVLYQMLTGRLPFKGDNDQVVLYAITNLQPVPLANDLIGEAKELQSVIDKALQKDASRRYQSIDELQHALRRASKAYAQLSPSSVAIKSPKVETSATLARRLWLITASILVASLILALGLLLPSIFRKPPAVPRAAISITTKSEKAEAFLKPKVISDTVVVEPPAAGGLNLKSAPSGFSVWLNGKRVGVTPCIIRGLAPGRYNFVLKKEGYKDYASAVTIISGQMSRITARLAPQTGKLMITAKPRGSIYIDGMLHTEDAAGPYTAELSPGSHLVRIEYSTLNIFEKRIAVSPDSLSDLAVDFTKLVKISISSGAIWGEIYVDGKATGRQTPRELTLPVGRHTIEVRREGYIAITSAKMINLESDVREPLTFTLEKKP